MRQDASVEGLLKQGHEQLDREQNEAALEIFQQAAQMEAQNPQVLYGLGLACYRLERYQDSVQYLNQALQIQPSYILALAWRGLAYQKRKLNEQATADFEQAIQIEPQDYEDWRGRGIALYELQRYEEAIASFDKALEIQPDDYNAWNGRGGALRNLGRYEEAIASYDKALEIQPNFHYAWYYRGHALRNLGRYEEAITSYDKALEIQPDFHYAWYYRGGTALENLGRYEEAIASLAKALEIQPDFHYAWFYRGIALENLGRYQEAIASYDKALEIQPDFHYAWNSRGGVLCDQLQRYKEAIASFDEVLRLTDNQFWQAWRNRGIALFKSGRYEAALKTWNKGILALQPQTPDYQEGCGELHRIKGSHQYYYGKQQPNPFPYWFEAKESYKEALNFLSFEQFHLRHLEVLQELLKVCSDLGDSQTIEARLEKGTQYLEELLRQCQFEGEKITLARKFAAFNQLRVDALAQSPEQKKQIAALELAEKRKNTCLGWLRHGWDYIAPSPNYQQMQQLLNPKTAAIYWHVSPTAITTFILRHKKDPLVWTLKPATQKASLFGLFSQPVTAPEEAHLDAMRQLEAFEEWMATWKRDYENYRAGKTKNDLAKDHPWRKEMAARLQQLTKILDISRMLTQLDGVKQLILIPHRDLHLLPLHDLFPEDFTITYLPSAQIGLDLQQPKANPGQRLLNVENPQNDLRYATVESAAIRLLYPDSKPPIKGQQATREEVMKALQTDENLGVFHFTGHGEHDINQPLESALLLSGEDELTLRDIFQLDCSRYHLICLSACETALTSKQGLIDEFVGLISGFLAKGAAYVVSSLWAVDERSTALLMVRFYQYLQENMTLPSALKEAQKWLRTVTNHQLIEWYQNLAAQFEGKNSGIQFYLNQQVKRLQKNSDKIDSDQPLYAHPYYWAGFTVTGKV